MAVEMTDFEEKVWKYLLSHPKTPVQAKTIAKAWIVSDNKGDFAAVDLARQRRLPEEILGVAPILWHRSPGCPPPRPAELRPVLPRRQRQRTQNNQ
jgi:hypothetical protein